jgi:hypothetical protein
VKSLIYDIYRHGRAGLSNSIMSIEIGVVLACLTDRLLILRGNGSPRANIVSYGDAISNAYPSKVTDLIDLGVPWTDAEKMNLAAFAPHDLCLHPIWECVFYFPSGLSAESDDIRAFAGSRGRFITVADDLQKVPALSLSGGPENNTLSFYSYFFYLDRAVQSQAFDALRRMKPKPEYEDFARRVVGGLKPFNAAHIRRGDFKKTRGVTTLDRVPEEAIAALDQQFSRKDRLVVLTDEADDPFFKPITAAFKDCVFIDHHILAQHRREFLDLPAHDSTALAYISRLVAAESQDFIGSMRSTFTALIQRMRGNSGKQELFKFLWNEQHAAEDVLEPGRHRISDSIRLDKGVMVPEREGRYSWTRHTPLLNPAWMREWPESFLNDPENIERTGNRELSSSPPPPPPVRAAVGPKPGASAAAGTVTREFAIAFQDMSIAASSNRDDAMREMRKLFAMMLAPDTAAADAQVRVEFEGEGVEMLVDGRPLREMPPGSDFLRSFYRQIVCCFIERYRRLVWLHAASAASSQGAVVLPGEWARGKSSLVMALCKLGWSYLSDDIAPLDPSTGSVLPFPATPQVRFSVDRTLRREEMSQVGKSAIALEPDQVASAPEPLAMIVFPLFSSGAAAELRPISRGQAVGKMLENCLSFVNNENATIQRLCRIIEKTPTYILRFGDSAKAAGLLAHAYALRTRAVMLVD